MLAASLLITSLLGSALAAPYVAQRAEPAVHTVQVGVNATLNFSPEAIFANPGDIVSFVFTSKNHSVVQSSFAEPCGPIDSGFNSGFQLVAAGTADAQLPVVNFTVTTTTDVPVWFYCSQAAHTPNSHCFQGMVFAINCPATGDKSFANFKAKATTDAFATNPAPPATPSPTDVIVPLAPEPTYPGITVPPMESAVTKTGVITLGTSTWTTTYASYPDSPDPTPSSVTGTEIKILVGNDSTLTFSPAYVVAKPRDTLVFEFQTKNHSVVQSAFASPCSPFASALGVAGVNSGFMPVTAGQALPQFRVTVNDTTPLYFYCSQTGHCGKGMVFAVNTDEQGARSSAAFQTLAKEINGTASNSSTGSTGGSGSGGGAASLSVGGLAVAGVIAVVAGLLL